MGTKELAVIETALQGKEVVDRISASLGKPMTDPSVMRHINGAIMYIKSKIGTKGDVSHCTKQSIIDSLINAATVGLPVDNKHYACLVAYKNNANGTFECNFQPEWRGYVAKVKEADASAVITVGLVYEGDVIVASKDDNNAHYDHKIADPFQDDPKKITGGYCFIKTDSGSYLDLMSRKELDAVRSQSKVAGDFMWKNWTTEMYKKTVIRRGCKVKFTEAVSSLDALDNKLFNERPEKIAPSIASDSAPLPAERRDIPEAEVVGPEGDGKEPAAEDKAPEGTQVDTGDLQTMEGAIEKYHKPYKATAPHCWKMNGQLFQIFEKDNKTGADNTPIINLINEADKAMKNVKITYRHGSYQGKDGLEVKTLNIVNAYPADAQ